MDGERKSYTERILSAIEYGKLPNDETERRVRELVEEEVDKTDSEADLELIKACQSLMWQLHTHGEIPYDSHYNASKTRIERRLRQKDVISNAAKLGCKTLTAAAAVILLLVGVRISWFEHSDTPDSQQHVITGQEITIEVVQAAIAENVGRGSVETTDLKELREIIGFDPQIPETLNDGWNLSVCTAWFLRNSVQVTIKYNNVYSSDEELICAVTYFTNVDDGDLTFEQSAKGESIMIGDEKVYLTQNIDHYVACWQTNNIIIEVNGNMNKSVFLKILGWFIDGGV